MAPQPSESKRSHIQFHVAVRIALSVKRDPWQLMECPNGSAGDEAPSSALSIAVAHWT